MVAVYTIHYDRPDWTARTVASCLASTGVAVQLTVVDNGGAPASVPRDVRVLRQDVNRGFSGGANAALRDWAGSDDEWIVITAHDLIVDPGAFAAMLAAGAQHPELGIVAPEIDDERPPFTSPLPAPADDGIRRRAWVSGVCMMLRRGCVEATGMFDEDYGSWWEDIDYGNRAGRAGWGVGQVVAAHARTLGRAGGSRAEISCHANRLLFAAKHGGPRAVAPAAWTLVKQAAWAAGHGDPKGMGENLAAIAPGLVRAARVRRSPSI